MSENPQICAGDVYLVAPAFGDKFNPEAPYDEPLRGGFFDFKIDEALLDRMDAAFTGIGCAISQASTSMMIDLVKGKPVDEARRLAELFISMIKGRELTEEELES